MPYFILDFESSRSMIGLTGDLNTVCVARTKGASGHHLPPTLRLTQLRRFATKLLSYWYKKRNYQNAIMMLKLKFPRC